MWVRWMDEQGLDTDSMEVSSGSVSEGGLSSASTDGRGFTTRPKVEPAWLKRPIIAGGGGQEQSRNHVITASQLQRVLCT